MQEFLIKVICFGQKNFDTTNYKFDTILVLEETLDTLKDQAPTDDSYDSLFKKMNMSFQRVIEKLDNHKPNSFHSSKAFPSHERGGEIWKPISKFKSRDEKSDDDDDVDIEFFKVAAEDVLVELKMKMKKKVMKKIRSRK
ncbi:unnamed protein product [Lactuca saligna]|uniref:Uncharacterized protein n=1 Tax=Lactuca saligna TaxID=75948 RepID=A0AA36EKT8_LACSI|nr:unnamed protein product [Lactuca saligna]